MEDKRILKTKKYLKQTLIELLNDEPFEQITVTRLCKKADISRITFYTHYSDKYALVEDIFQDMIALGTASYEQMQSANNPELNMTKGFMNVMDAILDLYYGHFDFFRHTSQEDNPYLAFSFYNHIFNTVEHHTNKERAHHRFKFSSRQITGFLCYGIIGFINACHDDHMKIDDIRLASKDLLMSLLNSNTFLQI